MFCGVMYALALPVLSPLSQVLSGSPGRTPIIHTFAAALVAPTETPSIHQKVKPIWFVLQNCIFTLFQSVKNYKISINISLTSLRSYSQQKAIFRGSLTRLLLACAHGLSKKRHQHPGSFTSTPAHLHLHLHSLTLTVISIALSLPFGLVELPPPAVIGITASQSRHSLSPLYLNNPRGSLYKSIHKVLVGWQSRDIGTVGLTPPSSPRHHGRWSSYLSTLSLWTIS